MKDPIKIIHKFKNNNRRIQYKVYIFIGSLVPKTIMAILERITDKDLYQTFNSLLKNEYNELETYYGEYWYTKFFISYHINNMINIINTTDSKKKTLQGKYGKEWYDKHFINYSIKRMTYSFANEYYNNLLFRNKIKGTSKKIEMDFTSTGNINLPNLKGGNDEDTDDEDTDEDDDDGVKIISEEEEENKTQEFEEQVEEDFDLDEITKLYSTIDVENSKNIKETYDLISEAINNKKWEKVDDMKDTYDSSLDNITYDSNINDIYLKQYITSQYIFKDETIKSMRQKISLTIPISQQFSKSIKILPETQYFWSEYYFENKKDHVMLGQKWIRRNELLKIDIIPNENIKIYEKLRNNLAYLKDSFGYKIKREDDETNIIRAYEDYMTMNEIFMVDVYNDLGISYSPDPEEKRNMYDVYINIYYPLITFERLEQIIQLLNGLNEKEIQYIDSVIGTIRNDIKLETFIEETVEKAKLDMGKFNKLFSENHIIQSIIHVNVINPKNITGTVSESKFNLYRIFDNFIVDMKYPFIQYMTPDSQLTYKFYTKTDRIENQEILSKWFENAPYGISFKIKLSNINDKYISISLYENGRIEYKITWKEIDIATIEDIRESYEYVRDLIKKINTENKKIKFILPTDDRFKYAFINTIQKFNIPENFKIDHNDFSEFSRFFFPYISLVIEPKKRKSKKQDTVEETSKYGTYLRYKRISKYENRTKMHLRILYFLRNYEFNDRELIDEIAKQFNITSDIAAKELDYVREKYVKVIKKSKKLLKKLKSMPKSKPPGIGIDIQGRDKDNYKIRITGSRNKEQLEEIIDFMKVLIYLYVETYLYKKKEFQSLKDTLKTLNKIAKRRNKVNEIVEYDNTHMTVKTITNLDKARLGFKPEKGQSQWSRSCQNSGTDKKRRPDVTPGDMMDKLLKEGYKLNKTTGFLEREIEIKVKGKVQKTIIKAIKLAGEDNTFNFYSCNPSENEEHKYVGFLARGNNPSDLCMPCCFKKDQLTAGNKTKFNYFMKCIGDNSKETKSDKMTEKNLTDKLYILQETNKVQSDRYIFLPKYLDIFFNKIWNHDHKIKNHYLLESKSGYFFKYTVKHDYFHLLTAISNIYNKTIETIISILIHFLEKDKNDMYFTYLNNGDISEIFKTRENFIEYLKSSNYLEYDMIGELLAIPGVISEKGINFFILNKQSTIIKKALEKEEIKEKYYLDCLNSENYYMMDEDRDIVVLIKEDKYYFPIYRVIKGTTDKKILVQKYYSKEKYFEKILNELRNYHSKSCKNMIISNTTLIAKNIIQKLSENFSIKKQYIDDRHKCKYIELNDGIFIPVIPSGIDYIYSFTSLRNIKTKWLSLKDTIKSLDKIDKLLKLDFIPKTIFYDKKTDNKIHIISILLLNTLTIPITMEDIDIKTINKLGLSIKFQPLAETLDKEIINYNNTTIYDERYKSVKEHNYMNESYNLYRLELSLFLNNNSEIKETIINTVRNQKMSNKEKKHELRKILFQIIDPKLNSQYKLSKEMKGGTKGSQMGYIVKALPDLKDYIINNVRDYCNINKTKDKCNTNLHCSWVQDTCKFTLLENSAIDFVNKVLEEMIQDGIKFKEIIQEYNYYVSDIVDYTQYTNRDDQKIIKSTNSNITKLMNELFGKDKVPTIGKRHTIKTFNSNEVIEEVYPELIEMGKQYIQNIISNKDSIIRSYINSYYWIKNPLYDIESRNLGYYNTLQTNLTYLFKADMIEWIQDNIDKGPAEIKSYLLKYFKNDINFFESTINKFRKSSFNTDGKVELFILSHMIDIPIVVYDNYSNIKYLFLQGEIPVTSETIKNFTLEKNLNKTIFLKFDYDSITPIPNNVYSIYYL